MAATTHPKRDEKLYVTTAKWNWNLASQKREEGKFFHTTERQQLHESKKQLTEIRDCQKKKVLVVTYRVNKRNGTTKRSIAISPFFE